MKILCRECKNTYNYGALYTTQKWKEFGKSDAILLCNECGEETVTYSKLVKMKIIIPKEERSGETKRLYG